MGLFDSIFGGTPARKSTSGPHVTRLRKLGEKRERMADTAAAVSKNTAVSDALKAKDAEAAGERAKAEKRKKLDNGINFYKKILKKK